MTASREGDAMELWLPVMHMLFAGIHAAALHLEAGRFSRPSWVEKVRARGEDKR